LLYEVGQTPVGQDTALLQADASLFKKEGKEEGREEKEEEG